MDSLILKGHLDIFVTENKDSLDGELMEWQEILIHGDPEGLRSFAKLLINLADRNQEKNTELPIGARDHIHLRSNRELSKSSLDVIVGRLDSKGNGDFYDRFKPKD
jgi:hypothetical protein